MGTVVNRPLLYLRGCSLKTTLTVSLIEVRVREVDEFNSNKLFEIMLVVTGIKLPYLVMIIKNMKKYFTFEVQVSQGFLIKIKNVKWESVYKLFDTFPSNH